jgi:formimidoylglutamate deiminase
MEVLRPQHVWTGTELRSGWGVAVEGGRIAAWVPPGQASPGEVRLGGLLMPGLVDAHSHAFQRAFRGHVQWRDAERDDFWTWRQAMYATANRLTPEGVFAVSRLAFLELAEAGVTEVGEFHYLHHAPDGARYEDPDLLARQVIAAALDVGIRITLLRVAYARHSYGRPLDPDQQRFGDRSPDDVLAAIERLRAIDDPRVRIGLAPHSVRAVPAAWLAEFARFVGPIHAHVAEQPAEVAACRAEHGRSPLQVFVDAGLVDDRFCAVHLTHPDDGDVERIVAADAAICVCPSTELDLGDGFLPLHARAARLCVGSDSHALTDPLVELRDLELHARALARRRNVMTPPGDRHGLAALLLQIGTHEGTRALGGTAATLDVGRVADLVHIDLGAHPAAAGLPPLEAAALRATGDWVTDVWVAGDRVVADGRHPRREAIVEAARPHLAVSPP